MNRTAIKQHILKSAGSDTLPVVFFDILQSGYGKVNSLGELGIVTESVDYNRITLDTVSDLEKWGTVPAMAGQQLRTLVHTHLGNSAESDLFVERGLNRGLLAMVMAKELSDVDAWDAFIAGLFLDSGKLALATLKSNQGTSTLHSLGRDDGAVLDAERDHFGVEHTQAGKWLSESWGLSAPCTYAIWLHHHSATALQYLNCPTNFIKLLQCCDMVVHSRDEGEPPKEALPLLKALAISSEKLQEQWALVNQFSSHLLNRSETVSTNINSDQRGNAHVAALEQSVEQMSQRESIIRLSFEEDAAAILRLLASTMLVSYGIEQGMAWTISTDGHAEVCYRWEGGEVVPVDPKQLDHAGNSVASLLQILENSNLPTSLTRAPFNVTPLKTQQHSIGYVAYTGNSAQDESLHALLESAAIGLGLIKNRESKGELEESLALGLWQQEAALRNQKMQIRMEGIQQLAAGTAHEINNPLAVISGRAQVLLQRSTEPKVVQALEAIVDQSRRANKIIVDLMQFARPDPPCKGFVSLEQVVRQLVATVRERLNHKGIQIKEDIASKLPQINVDRRQIEQVLLQLIQNSERAMLPRGGTLTMVVRLSQDGHSMILQCRDTGVGMVPEQLDHVFEPFYTTDHSSGTGLGLAMCHSIVQRHEGSITFQSTQGAGTTCTITFPMHNEAKSSVETLMNDTVDLESIAPPPSKDSIPTIATAHAPTTLPDTAPRLLLADGDKNLLEVLCGALEGRGFAVSVVHDSLEIHAGILSQEVDALLCDYSLIGNDGLGLLEDITRRKAGLPIIVFVNQYISEEELLTLRRSGVKTCLRKPFELHLLLRELNGLLPSPNLAQGA